MPAKLGQFAVAQRAPGSEHDEQPKPLRHPFDDRRQLGQGGWLDPSLPRRAARTRDVARARRPPAFNDGLAHDGSKQRVGMGALGGRSGPRASYQRATSSRVMLRKALSPKVGKISLSSCEP